MTPAVQLQVPAAALYLFCSTTMEFLEMELTVRNFKLEEAIAVHIGSLVDKLHNHVLMQQLFWQLKENLFFYCN